jgi:hypothetical protein
MSINQDEFSDIEEWAAQQMSKCVNDAINQFINDDFKIPNLNDNISFFNEPENVLQHMEEMIDRLATEKREFEEKKKAVIDRESALWETLSDNEKASSFLCLVRELAKMPSEELSRVWDFLMDIEFIKEYYEGHGKGIKEMLFKR